MKKQNNSENGTNVNVTSMDLIAVMPDDELETNIRNLNERLISNKRDNNTRQLEVELAYFMRERGVRELRRMKHTEYQANQNNKNKQNN